MAEIQPKPKKVLEHITLIVPFYAHKLLPNDKSSTTSTRTTSQMLSSKCETSSSPPWASASSSHNIIVQDTKHKSNK